MNNSKISLAIFGNQNSNSGFQPLYWINDPPQQLENIVPPGMDENLFFFTLQVLPSHTEYTLIHNRVSSYMSVRPGVLKMAVAIPRGCRIRDGVSPMTVLLEVRRTFLETCMTQRDATSESYNFKEKLADPAIFAAIVDAYKLEPDTQSYLPMTGTDDMLMLLDDAAIAQLFLAPHRPEFTRFRRIVVANNGYSSFYKTIEDVDSINVPANEATDKTATIKTEKKEADSVESATDKLFCWKKYLPFVLCLLLMGSIVFVILNASSSTSEVFADNDTEATEEMTDEENDEATEEKKNPSNPTMEKEMSDKDKADQGRMEQAIRDAYVQPVTEEP